MRLSTWGIILATMFGLQAILLTGEVIQFELREGSRLIHDWADIEGDSCAIGGSAEIDLKGGFLLEIVEQSKQSIEGKVTELRFEEIEGADYTIVGLGGYLEDQMNFSHTAEPPRWAGYRFDLMINDHHIVFTPEPFGITFDVFPTIRQGLRTDGLKNDCFIVAIAATPTTEDAKRFFRRGDVDGNGARNLTDAIQVITHLFGEGIQISCSDAADANDDAKVDIADAITVLNYLFRAAELPPIPSTFCGLDPTSDGLDCQGQAACTPEL